MPSLRQLGAVVTGSAGVLAALLFSKREQLNLGASSKHGDQNSLYEFEGKRQRWDYNWDKMAPTETDSDGKKEGSVEAVKPTASRTLILIRHGQYIWDPDCPDKRILTELGKKQAVVTGQRLKELGHSYSVLHFSTMPRATETAQIILQSLSDVSSRSCDLMREGAPIRPEPMSKTWHPESHVRHYHIP